MSIYETTFSDFYKNLTTEQKNSFLDHPIPYLEKIKIPVVYSAEEFNTFQAEPSTSEFEEQEDNSLLKDSKNINLSKHWWGVELKLNNATTVGICTGTLDASTIAGFIGAITPLAIVAVPVAAGLFLKARQMQLVNKGKGVHFNIYWPEFALLISPFSVAEFMIGLIPHKN